MRTAIACVFVALVASAASAALPLEGRGDGASIMSDKYQERYHDTEISQRSEGAILSDKYQERYHAEKRDPAILSDKYEERYHAEKRDAKAPIMSDKYEERYHAEKRAAPPVISDKYEERYHDVN